jgi:phospholipid-binding lipoprotein MlaA
LVQQLSSLSIPTATGRLGRQTSQTWLAAFLAAAAMGAPAMAQTAIAPASGPVVAQAHDPWEGTNRGLYTFSMKVDGAAIAPVIHGYRQTVPGPVQTALKHAIDNLDEPRIAANDVLQGHLKLAAAASVRFVINSTYGIAGFFDVAGASGIRRHDADFGQTLGRYGVGAGPYIFVPLIGPNNVRDGIGRIVDAIGDPVGWATGGLNTTFGQVRDGVYVFQARVDVDDQLTGLKRDFTDPYATLRSGYSQNRAYVVAQARGESAAAAVDKLPDFGPEPAPEPPVAAPH